MNYGMKIRMRNGRFWLRVALLAVLLISIGLTRFFTEQDGTESNKHSRLIASYIQKAVAKEFPVNPNDTFWTTTLNALVRKAAHFLEYMLVGILLCLFLNTLSRRIWMPFWVSSISCVLLACLDELRQKFVAGRSSKWFDVQVDSFGAIMGIILTTVLIIIYYRYKRLKLQIERLEKRVKTANRELSLHTKNTGER